MTYPAIRPTRRAAARPLWDPTTDVAGLRAEMLRMMGMLSGLPGTPAAGAWSGDVDIEESDDGWTVTARLPGVAAEEVIVEVEGRDLSIRSKTEELPEGVQEPAGRQRYEFNYRFTIPGEVDSDAIDASMENGLLTVRLPRSAQARRRQISIGGKPT